MCNEEDRITSSICLSCDAKLDMARDMKGGQKPSEGDISICIKCGHLAAFSADLSLRELTESEIISVAGNPDVIQMNNARAEMMRKKNG